MAPRNHPNGAVLAEVAYSAGSMKINRYELEESNDEAATAETIAS
jgi:hypothetical protein